MIRTLHAGRFNEIAAHPVVRPFLGGTHAVDLTDIIANPENFAFLTEDENGGYLYHKKGLGLYEVHCLALPEGRNRHMLAARSASLREMFIKSDAVQVDTIVPAGNKGADIWAQHAGFREVFTRAKAFDLMGEMVDVSYRSLQYGEWVLKDRGNLEDGRAFHQQIHQYTPDDHGDDRVHDAWVGATAECCSHGNAIKGVTFFNRWASHAGYQPIAILTTSPLVLDIRSAIIQADADGLHLLHVREKIGEEAPARETAPVLDVCVSGDHIPS